MARIVPVQSPSSSGASGRNPVIEVCASKSVGNENIRSFTLAFPRQDCQSAVPCGWLIFPGQLDDNLNRCILSVSLRRSWW